MIGAADPTAGVIAHAASATASGEMRLRGCMGAPSQRPIGASASFDPVRA
jgi:hypothetical protein